MENVMLVRVGVDTDRNTGTHVRCTCAKRNSETFKDATVLQTKQTKYFDDLNFPFIEQDYFEKMFYTDRYSGRK